jgi:hypothetical protein
MQLEEMKKRIENLVITKGFYNKPEDIPKNCFFALSNWVKQVTLGKRELMKRKNCRRTHRCHLLHFRCSRLHVEREHGWHVCMEAGRRIWVDLTSDYGEGHRNKAAPLKPLFCGYTFYLTQLHVYCNDCFRLSLSCKLAF